MTTYKLWVDYLKRCGATIENDLMTAFPQSDKADTNVSLYALTHLSVLAIEGEEAQKFLQGQLTCDISSITASSAQFGAQCNPKGRVIFNFLAAGQNNAYLLRCEKNIADTARKSLGKYMVFSKAEFVDDQCEYVCLGLKGTGSQAVIDDLFKECPGTTLETKFNDDTAIIKLADDQFEIWVKSDKADNYWESLSKTCQVEPTEAWLAQEIRQGRVLIDQQTSEEFIPQTINLTSIGAVSFTKGCYTGQEVVARMQYLGKQKKHTYRAITDVEAFPNTGDNLYTEGSEQSIGKIVNVASTKDFTKELLICVTDAAFEADSIYLDPQKVTKLTLATLPYAITNEQKEEQTP